MSYFILLLTVSLILAMVLHLKYQLHKTAGIRQDLHEARSNKILTDLGSLRGRRD